MYVENEKISSRQTYRLFVFDLMGSATLLLPPYLARLCGVDGLFAILIGTVLGCLYLFYLGWLMRKMGMSMKSYLNQRTRSVIRSVVFIFVLVHGLFTSGFCSYIFASLMQYSLVRESGFEVILFVILVVAGYAVSGGLESRARVYEVLFWFILVPYLVMMLVSVKHFEVEYITGFLECSREDFWKGVYLVFLFFTPLFFSLFLLGEKEKYYGIKTVKTISKSVFTAGGILLGSYVILMGCFGGNALASMRYPVVTLMSTIQFQGNFLKRMDAFMLAVWFFTLYALLNLHLHYVTSMLQEIFSKGKKKSWQVVCAVILVYGIGKCMYADQRQVQTFVNYYSYIAVPAMVVLPGIALFSKKRR